MILVLLGTQVHPFNRLVNELIMLVEEQGLQREELVIQAGETIVDDPRFVVFNFLPPEQLEAFIAEADLIITHGGAGSIFSALHKEKKVIALARNDQLGEHVDGHQSELVQQLYEEKYLIGEPTLRASFALLDTFKFKTYQSGQKQILEQMRVWLEL